MSLYVGCSLFNFMTMNCTGFMITTFVFYCIFVVLFLLLLILLLLNVCLLWRIKAFIIVVAYPLFAWLFSKGLRQRCPNCKRHPLVACSQWPIYGRTIRRCPPRRTP